MCVLISLSLFYVKIFLIMNKYLLSFCICLTVVTACNNRDKKEIVISEPKPKPYSYWKINGQEFSSNNVEGGSGKAISIFLSHDSVRFDLSFNLPFFPDDGNWPILGVGVRARIPM